MNIFKNGQIQNEHENKTKFIEFNAAISSRTTTFDKIYNA